MGIKKCLVCGTQAVSNRFMGNCICGFDFSKYKILKEEQKEEQKLQKQQEKQQEKERESQNQQEYKYATGQDIFEKVDYSKCEQCVERVKKVTFDFQPRVNPYYRIKDITTFFKDTDYYYELMKKHDKIKTLRIGSRSSEDVWRSMIWGRSFAEMFAYPLILANFDQVKIIECIGDDSINNLILGMFKKSGKPDYRITFNDRTAREIEIQTGYKDSRDLKGSKYEQYMKSKILLIHLDLHLDDKTQIPKAAIIDFNNIDETEWKWSKNPALENKLTSKIPDRYFSINLNEKPKDKSEQIKSD